MGENFEKLGEFVEMINWGIPSGETVKLYEEWRSLQRRIVTERIHDTHRPENTKIINRVKELYTLLKKSGYF